MQVRGYRGTAIFGGLGSKKCKHKDAHVWSWRRILTLRMEHFIDVLTAGYGDIIEDKPHSAITHIFKKLKPQQLYRRMMDNISWPKNINFHKEIFDRFVWEVERQAKKIEAEQRVVPTFSQCKWVEGKQRAGTIHQTKRVHHAKKPRQAHRKPAIIRQQMQVDKTKNNKPGKKINRGVLKAPLCLNFKCRGQVRRHYTSHCEISDQKITKVVLEQYRKNKRARYNGQKDVEYIGQITHMPTSTNSSIFRRLFAKKTLKLSY